MLALLAAARQQAQSHDLPGQQPILHVIRIEPVSAQGLRISKGPAKKARLLHPQILRHTRLESYLPNKFGQALRLNGYRIAARMSSSAMQVGYTAEIAVTKNRQRREAA